MTAGGAALINDFCGVKVREIGQCLRECKMQVHLPIFGSNRPLQMLPIRVPDGEIIWGLPFPRKLGLAVVIIAYLLRAAKLPPVPPRITCAAFILQGQRIDSGIEESARHINQVI